MRPLPEFARSGATECERLNQADQAKRENDRDAAPNDRHSGQHDRGRCQIRSARNLHRQSAVVVQPRRPAPNSDDLICDVGQIARVIEVLERW
jgi:hypothetical protein